MSNAPHDNATPSKRISVFALPVIGVSVSAALLGGAHAFEKFGGYLPCQLCLQQREAHWVALGLGVLALVAFWRSRVVSVRFLFAGLLGMAYGWSAGLAGYHAGVEYKWWPGPTTCMDGGSRPNLSGDLVEQLQNATKAVPCDEAPWHLLGISMAGYNFLISLAILLLAAAIIWQETRLYLWQHKPDSLNQV